MVEQNPHLISKKAMEQMSTTSGSQAPLMSEVFKKVHNAKVKAKKVEILKENNTPGLRMILKGAFDPKIQWDLPEGTPPFIANEAPEGTEHTVLENESKKLWHFIKGADDALTKGRKETLFIQVLEGLHKDEAEIVIAVKDKVLHRMFKGLNGNMVKDAFGWDENFMQKS